MAETVNEDGTRTNSIVERQKKRLEDHLSDKNNKAPTAKFIQRQKKLQNLINEM